MNRPLLRNVQLLLANTAWVLLSSRRYWAWRSNLSQVQRLQEALLIQLLRKNAESSFGERHCFKEIHSIRDFQARVPLSTYEDYLPYIDEIGQGRERVLTTEPVHRFEPTSGSTTASKFIPFTNGLREDFRNGLGPWIFDLFTSKPALILGSSYWVISPNTPKQLAGSVVPVGFGEDASYFGPWEQKVIAKVLGVPSLVAQIQDRDAFRYVTLLFLLRDENLAFISVWNPSFLTLLFQDLRCWLPRLIRDIRQGTMDGTLLIDPKIRTQLSQACYPDYKRARELENAAARNNNFIKAIWPRLGLISCWADGHAQASIAAVRKMFPDVTIQPKGLLATEGMISIPQSCKEGPLLSYRSHFFEFIEVDVCIKNDASAGSIRLAHQLEVNKQYEIVLTTSGGLYRYRLGDIIKVIGYKGQCPAIRFISRGGQVSDHVGEKLNEQHLAGLLEELFTAYNLKPAFFMLAPEKVDGPGIFYTLFVEFINSEERRVSILREVQRKLELLLNNNYHYAHCVNTGQILPARIFMITPGSNPSVAYINKLNGVGVKMGQVKPTILSSLIGWSQIFSGDYVG